MTTTFDSGINEMHPCRCCLLRPPDKDLKTPYGHLGKIEIYSDMLEECFNLHMTLGDNGECGICEVCIGRLRDASDFKLQVLRSQLEMRGALHVKDEPVETENDDIDDAAMCDSISVIIEKSECIDEDDSAEVSNLDPLMLPDEERSEEALPVPSTSAENALRVRIFREIYFCHVGETRQRFKDKSSLINHILEQVQLADLRTFSCEKCSEHFSNETNLIDHIQKHQTNKTFTCEVCNLTLGSSWSLIRHLKNHEKNGNKINEKKENKDTPVSCDVCNKIVRKGYLEMHKKIHTGEKPYSCEECGMRFTFEGSLKRHKVVHSSEKPFACLECGKQFNKKIALKAHSNIHTGKRPYSCKLCDKSFASYSGLQTHKYVHTGEKPHTCEICNKQFSQKIFLINHTSIHTGYKPYSCDECDYKSSRKWQLGRHKRSHRGEKPFECEVCNRRFSRPWHLRDHRFVHSGDRPYACDQCSKTFRQQSTLHTHKRIHTGEKPFKCEICNKTFRQLTSFKRHKKVHT